MALTQIRIGSSPEGQKVGGVWHAAGALDVDVACSSLCLSVWASSVQAAASLCCASLESARLIADALTIATDLHPCSQ